MIISLSSSAVVPGISSLTINGFFLLAATGTTTVTLNGVAQSIQSNSGTQLIIGLINASTPPGTAATLTVTTDDGAATTTLDVLGPFQMSSAVASGPTQLDITFNRAPNAATALPVRFLIAGLTVSTATTVGSITTLTVTTPLVTGRSYAIHVTSSVTDTFGAPAIDHLVTVHGPAPTHFVVAAIGNGVTTGANTVPITLERRSFASPTTTTASIALPSTAGDPVPFSVVYGNPAEAALSRSPDGRSLTICGYRIVAGTAANGTSPPISTRGVAIIDDADFATPAGVDLSTALGTLFGATSVSGSQIRSAVLDGANLWVIGGLGGTFLTTPGATTTPTTAIATVPAFGRTLRIFDGQLYSTASSGGTTTLGLYKIGTGLPTTSGTSAAVIDPDTSTGSAYAYSIFDVSDEPGPDLLYLFDEASGVKRFVRAGGDWVLSALFSPTSGGIRQGECFLQGPNDSATCVGAHSNGTASATSGGLYVFTDTAHALGNTALGTPIAAPTTNHSYRGVALAPQP